MYTKVQHLYKSNVKGGENNEISQFFESGSLLFSMHEPGNDRLSLSCSQYGITEQYQLAENLY